jgi:hypothetical protein
VIIDFGSPSVSHVYNEYFYISKIEWLTLVFLGRRHELSHSRLPVCNLLLSIVPGHRLGRPSVDLFCGLYSDRAIDLGADFRTAATLTVAVTILHHQGFAWDRPHHSVLLLLDLFLKR